MTRVEFENLAEKSIELGKGLIIDFAYDNAVMGLTVAQRKQIVTALQPALSDLLVGSLDLALDELQNLTPIATILEQDRIDKYIAKLQNLIGSLSE